MHTGPEVVAHRGASAYALEHTFYAYDLALVMGADSIELDVRLRDGRLVVLHDRTTARTLHEPLALADVLDRYDTRWLIELKDPCPALEAMLLQTLRGRDLDVTVQSFDHRSLRRLAGQVPVAALVCESTDPADVPAVLREVAGYAAGAAVLHTSVDPVVVYAARAWGLRLHAYTVNDPREMSRLLAAGVDGLITDRPDAARAAVDLLAPVTEVAA
jgi:glycerophosphoryl diester phosphodiesterase